MSARPPGRVLLDLVGSAASSESLALESLNAADWAALSLLAKRHRLEPLLYAKRRDAPGVPAALIEDWHQAYRHSAMTALVQQADLAAAAGLLEGKGFHPVALKGAFLARHAYPEAAQRPMRDVDLLLPAEQVLPGFAALREAGFAILRDSKISHAEAARLEMHMPPLISPRGTVLELHSRLSELDGRLEYRTPSGDEAAVLERAIERDGIRYPAPADMLGHLVIHAIYGHRLDCGPLLLSDVRHLIARHSVDWQAFWQAAEAGRWAHGAALVAALVRRFHGEAAVPYHAAEPPAPPAELVELGCDLLLQDWEAKNSARIVATMLSGGLGPALRRITGRVAAKGEAGVTIDRRAEGGRLRWLAKRLGQVWRDLTRQEVRGQARQLARFRRWLEQ